MGIVIANHNNSRFVAQAIQSVAGQSFRNLQVVVVDDASTDASDQVIRDCLCKLEDPRFDYLRLDCNIGQAGTVRRGLAKLETPFVSLLDSDDVWYENFVRQHLTAHLNADFPVALTYCDSTIIDSDSRLLAGTAWWFDADPTVPPNRTISPAALPDVDPTTGEVTYAPRGRVTLHAEWMPDRGTNSTASMMLRRSFVDLVLCPPDQQLRLYLDYYLSTFASLLTGTIAIHESLYGYRMHGLNKHSDASVLGGAYNSSTKPWGPIRTNILATIASVLHDKKVDLSTAFGSHRLSMAQKSVTKVLGKAATEQAMSKGWPLSLFERAASLISARAGASPRQWQCDDTVTRAPAPAANITGRLVGTRSASRPVS